MLLLLLLLLGVSDLLSSTCALKAAVLQFVRRRIATKLWIMQFLIRHSIIRVTNRRVSAETQKLGARRGCRGF
jgi:hypothetical protein